MIARAAAIENYSVSSDQSESIIPAVINKTKILCFNERQHYDKLLQTALIRNIILKRQSIQYMEESLSEGQWCLNVKQRLL